MESVFELPLIAFSRFRCAHFAAQGALVNLMASAGRGGPLILSYDDEMGRELEERLLALVASDSANIAKGVYPPNVLAPENMARHLLRIPRIMAESFRIARRRARGRTTEFDKSAKDYLEELPRYYRRNFHFQSDGYLSEHSAELYEHQVEILFSGAADAMRRLVIPPMREWAKGSDGRGLRILEIGAGTGRATRFVKLAFPKAKIVALDLSAPYLKTAQKRLEDLDRIDFVQGDGTELPFQDGSFDAVFSVFLFHELPLEERRKVLSEARRVLAPGGFFGLVDSFQKGDIAPLEGLLEEFPKVYHEPFFRNYAAQPMETLAREAGLGKLRKDLGFLSKVCWISGARGVIEGP